MPLVRIDLIRGTSAGHSSEIGAVIYEAMMETLAVPADDRFQVITEHPRESFIFDPGYLGITRTEGCVFIQVTLNAGRTVEAKRAFYQAVADGLNQKLGIRREDVFISLIEVAKENWSFGNGEAQYAE
jgi:4-oxalocrotonate tautomerase